MIQTKPPGLFQSIAYSILSLSTRQGCHILVYIAAAAAVTSCHNGPSVSTESGPSRHYLPPRVRLVQLDQTQKIPARQLFIARAADFGLGVRDSMLLSSVEEDDLGTRVHRFQQTLDGVPVYGSIMIVHERGGVAIKAVGTVIPNLSLTTRPKLTESDALHRALDRIDAKRYGWEDTIHSAFIRARHPDSVVKYPSGKLMIVPMIGTGSEPNVRLAYAFNILMLAPSDYREIWVDANDGSILRNISRNLSVDAVGTAATEYYGTRQITTDDMYGNGTRFLLRESGRGHGMLLRDLSKIELKYADGIPYYDYRSAPIPEEDDGSVDNHWTTDPVAYSAYWSFEQAFDYFFTVHHRSGWDAVGGYQDIYPMELLVHSKARDDRGNSAYLPAWGGILLGEPDWSNNEFAVLDVIGHEFTHGITAFTAQLDAESEPGALNESFSDIFGTALEFHVRGRDPNWTIGEVASKTGSYLRSLAEPGTKGDPDTYHGAHWISDEWVEDQSGPAHDRAVSEYIHSNCGVQNRWFYLLVNGGRGMNSNGDEYYVTGIGLEKASRIAYRTLTAYLGPSSGYWSSRVGSVEAAADLFGECSGERFAVSNAWHAVGVPCAAVRYTGADRAPVSRRYARQVIFENYTAPFGVPMEIESDVELRLEPGFTARTGSKFRAAITCQQPVDLANWLCLPW